MPLGGLLNRDALGQREHSDRELIASRCFRRGRSPRTEMLTDQLADLIQRLRDGRLKPIVGAVRPLAEAPAAFAPTTTHWARRSSRSPKADSGL